MSKGKHDVDFKGDYFSQKLPSLFFFFWEGIKRANGAVVYFFEEKSQ